MQIVQLRPVHCLASLASWSTIDAVSFIGNTGTVQVFAPTVSTSEMVLGKVIHDFWRDCEILWIVNLANRNLLLLVHVGIACRFVYEDLIWTRQLGILRLKSQLIRVLCTVSVTKDLGHRDWGELCILWIQCGMLSRCVLQKRVESKVEISFSL